MKKTFDCLEKKFTLTIYESDKENPLTRDDGRLLGTMDVERPEFVDPTRDFCENRLYFGETTIRIEVEFVNPNGANVVLNKDIDYSYVVYSYE